MRPKSATLLQGRAMSPPGTGLSTLEAALLACCSTVHAPVNSAQKHCSNLAGLDQLQPQFSTEVHRSLGCHKMFSGVLVHGHCCSQVGLLCIPTLVPSLGLSDKPKAGKSTQSSHSPTHLDPAGHFLDTEARGASRTVQSGCDGSPAPLRTAEKSWGSSTKVQTQKGHLGVP